VSPPPSLITLTTDFGTRDAYVGSMKGVILSIARNVSIVDISHDLPAHRVLPAALLLREVCPRFPDGTIHVAVVDPGVGGSRRPVLLRIGEQFYVGPDNGTFGLLLAAFGLSAGWQLDHAGYFPPHKRSRTFHGRDLFAPAAALLAAGVPPDSLGTPLRDPMPLDVPPCSRRADTLAGEVLWIDHFGNGVTNLAEDAIRDWSAGAPFRVRVADRTLPGLSSSYESVPRGEPLAILSSFGTLEIACNQAPAHRAIGLREGTPVTLEKAG